MPAALTKTFLALDQMLMTQAGIDALMRISRENPQRMSPMEKALRT